MEGLQLTPIALCETGDCLDSGAGLEGKGICLWNVGRLSSKDHRSHTTALASLPMCTELVVFFTKKNLIRGDSTGLESQHFGDPED